MSETTPKKRPLLKIRDRVIVFVIPFLVMAILSFSYLSYSDMSKNLLEQMETDGRSIFQSLRASISNMDQIKNEIDPDDMVKSISLSIDIFEFRFIAPNGVVQVSMFPSEVGSRLNNKDISAILSGESEAQSSFREKDGVFVYVALQPVFVNNRLIGVVELSLDASEAEMAEENYAPVIRSSLEQHAMNLTEVISRSVADYYNIRGVLEIERLMEKIATGADGIAELSILNKEGVVISSSVSEVVGENRQLLLADKVNHANNGRFENFLDYFIDGRELTYFDGEEGNRAYVMAIPMLSDNSGELNQILTIALDAEPYFARLENSLWENILVSAVIVLVLTGLIIVVLNRATRPMKIVSQIFSRMAQGDLTHKIHMKINEREVRELADSFNLSVESISQIITNVRNVVLRLAEYSSQIASASSDIRESSDGQSQQLTEISTSAEVIAGTSAGVADLCQQNADFTQQVRESANSAHDVIAQTIEGMKQIDSSLSESQSTLDKLEGSVDRISEISGIIGDIAEQTNLLALNAAIESARAGEHGRGFAVVADEVRRLASHTADSTRDIEDVVSTVKDVTERIVREMNENIVQSGEKVELATRANNSVQEILDMVENVAERSENIAADVEEGSRATSQISSSLEQFAAIMTQNCEKLVHIDRLSADLDKTSDELRVAVSKFKLD